MRTEMNSRSILKATVAPLTVVSLAAGCGSGEASPRETLPLIGNLDNQAIADLSSTTTTSLVVVIPTTESWDVTRPTPDSSTATNSTDVPVDITTATDYNAQEPGSNSGSMDFYFTKIGQRFTCSVSNDIAADSSVHPEDVTQSGFFARANGFPLEVGFGSAVLQAAKEHPEIFDAITSFNPYDSSPDQLPLCIASKD